MIPMIKKNFLDLCDEKICVTKIGNNHGSYQGEVSRKSAMKRKLNFKSNINRPFVRFSQDDNLSQSSSHPTIIFEVNDTERITD